MLDPDTIPEKGTPRTVLRLADGSEVVLHTERERLVALMPANDRLPLHAASYRTPSGVVYRDKDLDIFTQHIVAVYGISDA